MKGQVIIYDYLTLVAYELNNYGEIREVSQRYAKKNKDTLSYINDLLVSRLQENEEGIINTFISILDTLNESRYMEDLMKKEGTSLLKEIFNAYRFYIKDEEKGYTDWYYSLKRRKTSEAWNNFYFSIEKVGFSFNYGLGTFLVLFSTLGTFKYRMLRLL